MAIFIKCSAWVAALTDPADWVGDGGSTADRLVAYLSNVTPDATADSVKADLAEIATGSGYAGPVSLDNVGTRSGGVLTVTAQSFLLTAAGGSIGPFRYVVIADDTLASDPIVGWFDYGSAITLAESQTFAVLFSGAAVGTHGTLFTVQ